VFKWFAVTALALMFAGCVAYQGHRAGQAIPGESPWPEVLRTPGKTYRIDESRSELRILVYRAGPLARLGHNHVVVNRSLQGAAKVAGGKSGFWLTVPAQGFVVDELQARREEGADFTADVPDDAKAGTLEHMLSAAVLDAGEFPEITVRGVARAPGTNPMMATLTMRVAGHESILEMPFKLDMDSRSLSAEGSLKVRQSALGLTPYSLMLGALQVQDALTVKFKIVAVDSGATE
jgi:YceI-like domain